MNSSTIKTLFLLILSLAFSLPANAQEADPTDLCSRTAVVKNVIVSKVSGKTNCADITVAELAGVTGLSFVGGSLNGSSLRGSNLKSGDFAGLTGLTDLRLRFNEITTLPADIFSGLSALTRLELDNNQLSTLPTGVFSGLISLTNLNLSNNPLPASLPASLFADVPSTATIILPTGTTINAAAPTTVGSIPAQTTNLGIPLTVNVADKFSDPNDTLTYTVKSNNTATATVAVSGSTVTITPVAIGTATITVTATDTAGQTATQTFMVSVISSPLPNPTVCMRHPKVQEVIIQNVHGKSACGDITAADLAAITSLVHTGGFHSGFGQAPPKGSDFAGLTALTTLGIINNKAGGGLTTLPADLFQGLPALRSLSLNDNQLRTLPIGIFSGLSLEHLTLTGNPWVSLPTNILNEMTFVQNAVRTAITNAGGGGINAALPATSGTIPAQSLARTANPLTLEVATFFSDPGDTLTYTATSAAPAIASVAISGSTLTITPVALGTTNIMVTARDTAGQPVTQTFALTVGGDAVAVAAPNISISPATLIATVGTAIETITITNIGGAAVSYDIADSDGQSASLNDFTQQAGLVFNTATGRISGTLNNSVEIGTETYIITATNSGGMDSATITITVNNVAPRISINRAMLVANMGSPIMPITITPIGGGAVVSYSIAPDIQNGLLFDTTTGTISGTPDEVAPSRTYTITATNSGGTDTAMVTITVNAPDTTPPSVTISSLPESANIVNGDTVNATTLRYEVIFSELVNGFEIGDITVTGTAGVTMASNFSGGVNGTGLFFEFEVLKGNDDGTVIVSIAADAARDAADNGNTASGDYTLTIDTTPPTITLLGSATLTIVRGTDYTDAGATANDNIGGDITGSITTSFTLDGTAVASLNTAQPGTYIITYNVSDAASNPAMAVTRMVTMVEGLSTSSVIATAAGDKIRLQFVDQRLTNNGAAPGDFTLSGAAAAGITVTALAVDADDSTVLILSLSGNIAKDAVVTLAYTRTAGSISGVFSTGSISSNGIVIDFAATDVDTGNIVAPDTVPVTDTTAPDAPVITQPTTPTNNDSITISGSAEADATVTLSQNGDALATTATAGSNGDWSIEVTLSADNDGANTFTATATDQAGNASGSSNEVTVTLDQTKPAIIIRSTSSTNPTNDNPIGITLKFTEPLTGFDESDIAVTNGTITAGSYQVVSTVANGVAVNVTFTITPSADGIVALRIVANAATDAAGNGNIDRGSVFITYDGTAPDVAITSTAQTVNTAAFTLTGTTEAGATVDVLKDGTSIGAATVTAATWTFDVMLTEGANLFTVTASDAAGNVSEVSEAVSITLDNTAAPSDTTRPSVAISSFPVTANIVNGDTVNATTLRYEALFDESVSGFEIGDITVTGTAGVTMASGLTGAGRFRQFEVLRGNLDGTVIVSIAAGAAQDAADNFNTASDEYTLTIDTTPPVITRNGDAALTIVSGTTYTDAGATANDNIGGTITGSITTSFTLDGTAVASLNTAQPGTYIITYNVSDAASNPAMAVTRMVTMVEGLSPNTNGVIATAAGDKIRLQFVDQQLTNNSAAPGDFTLSGAAAGITVTGLAVDADDSTVLILTLSGNIAKDAAVTLAYTRTAGSISGVFSTGSISSNGIVIDFTATDVDTGNIVAPDTVPVTDTPVIHPVNPVTHLSSALIVGTAEPGATISVSVKAPGATTFTAFPMLNVTVPDTGPWFMSGIELALGTNTIRVTAQSAGKAVSEYSNELNIAFGPPVITVNATAMNVAHDVAAVTLTGTATSNGGTVTVAVAYADGTSANVTSGAVDGAGAIWSINTPLKAGTNTIVVSIRAQGVSGNSPVTLTITRATAPPDTTPTTTPTATVNRIVQITSKTIDVGGSSTMVASRDIEIEVTSKGTEKITHFYASEVSTAELQTIADKAVVTDGIDFTKAPASIDRTTTPTLVVNTAVDITVNKGACPAKGCEVTLSYEASDEQAGKDLYVFHYDGEKWEALPHVRRGTNTVTALADSFSPFALFNASTVPTTPVAVPSISISPNTLVATVGTAIQQITIVSSGGAVESYSIAPAIGNGLSFSTATGTISGTPTTVASLATYTITATNTRGSDSATIAITVNASGADKLAKQLQADNKQLNKDILPNLVQTMLASTMSAVSTRMEATFSSTPQAGSYQLDGQTVKLNGSGNLQDAMASKLPHYATSLKDGTMDWKAMLSRSSFVLPLNAVGEEGAGGATIWGSGDYNKMSGKLSDGDWKGDVFSLQLGVDQRMKDDLLAGGLVSWSKGDVDYTLDNKSGDYTHQITSVHPYLAWSIDDARLWSSVGYGQGELSIKEQAKNREGRSDTRLLSLSAGVSGRLSQFGQSNLNLKSDMVLAQIDIAGSSNKEILTDSLANQRLRLLLEIDRELQLASGGRFNPLMEIGLRYDGGAGKSGLGAVLGFGGRYANTGLTVEGKFHTLVGRKDYKEWGVQGTIRKTSANDQGLTFSLIPSYGATGNRANQVWERKLADGNKSNGDYQAQLDVNVGYGLFTSGGLLTPYSELRMGKNNRYRLGLRWKPNSPFSLHLYGERKTSNDSDRILLETNIRF